MNFNPEDVQKVAKAVVGLSTYLVECSSDYRACLFCDETQRVSYSGGMEADGGKFPHALDCPVLVAQDLLT